MAKSIWLFPIPYFSGIFIIVNMWIFLYMYLGTHLHVFLPDRALEVKFKILMDTVRLPFTEVKPLFTEAGRRPRASVLPYPRVEQSLELNCE